MLPNVLAHADVPAFDSDWGFAICDGVVDMLSEHAAKAATSTRKHAGVFGSRMPCRTDMSSTCPATYVSRIRPAS